jgi:hypothetical protein
MNLFNPDARSVVLAELEEIASQFHQLAAESRREAVIITYRHAAELVERRIDELTR